MSALREGVVSFSVAYELAKLSHEDQDKRVKAARSGLEKLTREDAAVIKDTERVAKPNKKALAAMLATAERVAANPRKRNAHGVAMGLRFVLGLADQQEVEAALQFEGELELPPEGAEDLPAPEEEAKPARRGKKKAESQEDAPTPARRTRRSNRSIDAQEE